MKQQFFNCTSDGCNYYHRCNSFSPRNTVLTWTPWAWDEAFNYLLMAKLSQGLSSLALPAEKGDISHTHKKVMSMTVLPSWGRTVLWTVPDIAKFRPQAFWLVLCKWLPSCCLEWFITKAALELSVNWHNLDSSEKWVFSPFSHPRKENQVVLMGKFPVDQTFV